MKPWLGTSEFLTDSAEQALLEQRGREILAQQARREARKTGNAKAKSTQIGGVDAHAQHKAA